MLSLLNEEGSIVDNATEIIDSFFSKTIDTSAIMNTANNMACIPSYQQKKIYESLLEIATADNDNISSLSTYNPKIYGKLSIKLSDLSESFRPYAECIVAFIDQWCANGGANDGRKYGYEICSTLRSWYVQQNILTGVEYQRNGLSWSLYGNAMSINVYVLIEDQLNETSKTVDYIKKTISFEDGSAKTFLENAQSWFSSHKTRTGRNIKIYGAYPTIDDAIKRGKYNLIDDYLNDNDTLFWGGLFSTYSNFTQWEYHPSLMPNEVWKIRQQYLNKSFTVDGNQNFLDRIHNNESISTSEASDLVVSDAIFSAASVVGIPSEEPTITKYLSTDLEIMEEDFLSLYALKLNINTSSRYSVESLFKWAIANPYSLLQVISYYRVCADVPNSVLFYNISIDSKASFVENSNGIITLEDSTRFTLTSDTEGNYYIQCYDMFGSQLTFALNSTYRLPCDYMPSSEDFDLVDLTDSDGDATTSNIAGDIGDIDKIGDEISKTASVYTDPLNNVNEFGPLSGISIDPMKPLYTAKSIAESINKTKLYNEMITPPNSDIVPNKSSAILDVTSFAKRYTALINPTGNEMVTPDTF